MLLPRLRATSWLIVAPRAPNPALVALLALGAAMCLGVEFIFIKRLSGREGPWRTLLVNNAIGLGLATCAVLLGLDRAHT